MAQASQIGSEPGFSVKLKSSVKSSCILMLLLLLCTGSRAGTVDENLLHNGDLREGTLNDPADWRAESLRHDPKTFSWSQSPGAPGELRTENIDQGNAQIGVFAGGAIWSLPIKMTRSPDWNSGILYFKIGTPREVPIVCLLVAPRGTAHFRRLLLTRTSAPPREADQVDLETKLARFEQFTRRTVPQGFKPPTGSRWTVPATILTLVAITLLGWFGFKRGETD